MYPHAGVIVCIRCFILFYYIDKRVLLENTPLVKLIGNYIRDPSGVYIFHILTNEYIDDVISRSFTAVRYKQSIKNGER